jgi:hypothetical protein
MLPPAYLPQEHASGVEDPIGIIRQYMKIKSKHFCLSQKQKIYSETVEKASPIFWAESLLSNLSVKFILKTVTIAI